MTATTKTPISPRERLNRGLTYTAVGPVDITRGTLGLSVQTAQSASARLRERYQKGRLAKELSTAAELATERATRELAAAQEFVAALPQALQEARHPKHRKRNIIVLSTAALATLAGGAIVFSIVRRSMQPEPSPRPPSVEVAPKP